MSRRCFDNPTPSNEQSSRACWRRATSTHNCMGVAVGLGRVLIIVIFIKDNIPDKIDIEWFKQGGGFIKSKHAPARRVNAGEKLGFWGALGAGAAVAVSGSLLL